MQLSISLPVCQQVLDNPQLKMQQLRNEFGLVSKALMRSTNPDAAFIMEAVFEDSQGIFRAVEANQARSWLGALLGLCTLIMK